MGFLEYPLSHPYPRERTFTIVTVVLIILVLPVLVLVNIVTAGYELVPALRPEFQANDTVPGWWNSPRLPSLLRRGAPDCEPKDFGRGDLIRLTPSLFEYKVLSAWRNLTARDPNDESRVEYRGESFNQCDLYYARFDFDVLEWTQTVTVAVNCSGPVNAFLETSITFANDITKDVIGQYYGYNTNLFKFLDINSRDYRKAVFAILDVISTDSLMIMGGQHLAAPVLTLSARINNYYRIESTDIRYLNGTYESTSLDSMGSASIYRSSVYNLFSAVVNAVYIDLNGPGPYLRTDSGMQPNNIFRDPSAVNNTFLPNQAPASINPDSWIGDTTSFYYGRVVAPYQSWAEMLIAGLPANITLGNLTGLPGDSKMVTSYLCPSYQLKPMSSFLSSIFVATATMYLSAWGAWAFVTAIVARQIRGPCVQCTCGALLDGDKGGAHNHEHGVVASGLAAGLVPPPAALRASSTGSDLSKEQDGMVIQELPKRSATA
ncbi:transmembrane protein [Ceratobasidium sp. AG-Ba]|nr:transmembrane protein [Ceratobasidium sp. AG-Ba]